MNKCNIFKLIDYSFILLLLYALVALSSDDITDVLITLGIMSFVGHTYILDLQDELNQVKLQLNNTPETSE